MHESAHSPLANGGVDAGPADGKPAKTSDGASFSGVVAFGGISWMTTLRQPCLVSVTCRGAAERSRRRARRRGPMCCSRTWAKPVVSAPATLCLKSKGP